MVIEPGQGQLTHNPGLLNGAESLSLEIDERKERVAEGNLGDAAADGRRPIRIGKAAVVPEWKVRQVGASSLGKGLEDRL